MNMNKKEIPIVVPVYGAVEYTKRLVESIKKNTDSGRYRLIIVNNGSTDGTFEYLSRLVEDPEIGKSVTALHQGKNLGFAGGVNKGLQYIRNLDWDHCVVMNNDIVVTEGWLRGLEDCITNARIPDATIGAVGPVSNQAGGTQGISIDYTLTTDGAINDFGKRNRSKNKDVWIESGYLVGLCWMMSRQFFDVVGYLDEDFGIGQWEDNEYFLRGQIGGFRYLIDHSTFIHHFFHKTFQQSRFDSNGLFHSNRDLYCNKFNRVGGIYDRLAEINYDKRGQKVQYQEDGHVRKYIVGAMRVRDGEKYLERTLDRVSQLVDEIVIRVDQRTKDATVEICKRYPKVTVLEVEDRVYEEWEARNILINIAYSKNPDWIFCFDADEIPSNDLVKDREYLTNPSRPDTHLWVFTLVQLWDEKNWRVDGLWGTFAQGRMFRALSGRSIGQGVFHCGSHPVFPLSNIRRSYHRIIHYGNCDPEVRKNKYKFYTETDTDKDISRILGGWKEYYWQLYYGKPTGNIDPHKTVWKSVPDTTPDPMPYGCFRNRDLYRHVSDETGMRLAEFDEDRTISLCMLAKNEAQFLPKCLQSVGPIVNEIIIVDTGSTDTTINTAEELGAKVYKFEWCNDFSAARNFSMSKVTSKWLLRLDPDEVLPYSFLFSTYKLSEKSDVDGYLFPIHNYMQIPKDLSDPNWVLSETTRMFRMQEGIKFRGLVHEEIDDSLREIAAKRAGPEGDPLKCLKIERVPFFIQHFGYLRDSKFLEEKWDYYCQLGEKQKEENPNDSRAYFNTAVHYLHQDEFEKALEGYKKVIELDPKEWKALNDMAVILWKCGKQAEAIKYIRRAKECMGDTIHVVHKQKVEQNLRSLQVDILSAMIL